MKVDVLATLPHYRDWLLPISERVGAMFHDGSPPLPDNGVPTVIAGFGDLSIVPQSRPVALVCHGAGQTYRDVDHGSYNGGRGRDRISLFIYSSPLALERNAARYPDAAHVLAGPIRLGAPPPRPVNVTPVVGFAWHFELGICPETRSAFPWYRETLRQIVASDAVQGAALLGSGHPRDRERLDVAYRDLSITPCWDAGELVARCDLICADNTSLMYEAAAQDCPVLALDAPWFRAEVSHGLRFWSDVPGLRLMAHRDQRPDAGLVHEHAGAHHLRAAIGEALDDRPELAGLRADTVARVYGDTLDGKAADRAAEAVRAWSR